MTIINVFEKYPDRFRRPEDIMKIVNKRPLNSREIHILKSRSFGPGTTMYGILRGPTEIDIENHLIDAYDYMRYLDTKEDANPKEISEQTKISMIDHSLVVMNKFFEKEPGDSIDDLVSMLRGDFIDRNDPQVKKNFEEVLLRGCMDEYERVFVKQFNNGCVFRSLQKYTTLENNTILGSCINSMASGMKFFLENKEIKTKEEMDFYTKSVAGGVGEYLTAKIKMYYKENIPFDEGYVLSRLFGRGLQQINILKNINEDWTQRGVSYIPTSFHEGVPREVLFDIKNRDGKKARRSCIENIVADTRKLMVSASDYTLALPSRYRGYFGFIEIAQLAANEVLDKIAASCPDNVFAGNREVIGMDRNAFVNIMNFTYNILMRKDNCKRAYEFMRDYKKAQVNGKFDRFSFGDKAFKKLSQKYLAA